MRTSFVRVILVLAPVAIAPAILLPLAIDGPARDFDTTLTTLASTAGPARSTRAFDPAVANRRSAAEAGFAEVALAIERFAKDAGTRSDWPFADAGQELDAFSLFFAAAIQSAPRENAVPELRGLEVFSTPFFRAGTAGSRAPTPAFSAIARAASPLPPGLTARPLTNLRSAVPTQSQTGAAPVSFPFSTGFTVIETGAGASGTPEATDGSPGQNPKAVPVRDAKTPTGGSVQPVPIGGTLPLLGAAILGLGLFRGRRVQARH